MFPAIDSPKNARVKLLRSLSQKKFRDQTGLFAVEGEKLIEEAQDWGFAIEFALFADGDSALAASLADSGTQVFAASEQAIRAACDTETPQGCVAAVRIPDHAGTVPQKGLWAVLDGVQDPGNVGAIIRCADAFGSEGVLLGPGCADPWSPKAVRSAMGSSFHIPVVSVSNLPGALGRMRSLGFRIIAAHLSGSPELPDSLGASVALLIGSEGRGLSEEVSNEADILYRLPMKGNAESLNAAVAAGVILYELSKRMV
ncbi:MAG: TrmH family RNA methyltransferase [Christensenellales bacterium]|jgi:TrmH family RNA methyltransferase